MTGAARTEALDAQTKRVFRSARHLTEHLQEVPLHAVPCMLGRLPERYDNFHGAAFYGSIHPAIWSFMLALRRAVTPACTRHCTSCTAEAAELLGIPAHITQIGLIAVAPFLGDDFGASIAAPSTRSSTSTAGEPIGEKSSPDV